MNENNVSYIKFTFDIKENNVNPTSVKNFTSFINNKKYVINLMVRILFY
jgi:hypothetical protein